MSLHDISDTFDQVLKKIQLQIMQFWYVLLNKLKSDVLYEHPYLTKFDQKVGKI